MLDRIDLEQWREVNWKQLFKLHAVCMHPLLHKELTSQIIDQTTSMSSHDRLVSTPDRDLDMIGSAVERIRTARYKQICYDKRKAELINKYRSNTISEDEMEAIFLELVSSIEDTIS